MQAKTPLEQAYGRFRATLFTALIFSFCLNLLMFIGPLYMLQIYDRVLSSRNENTLYMITGIALALLVSYGLLDFVRSRLLVRAGMQFDEAVASPTFDRVVRQQTANPGTVSHVVLTDIDKVREFLTGQGILAFFDAPWVPLFLALCFAFHPWLGVVASIGAVLIFVLALTNELSTRKLLQNAGLAGQGANHFASTTLQNAEVIRAMGMERPLADRWLEKHDVLLENQAAASARASMIMSATKFIRMGLQIAILGTGAYLAMQQQISAGIMIAASIIMGRALSPVEQAVGQWKQFVAARQSHGRLKKLFDSVKDEEERLTLPAPTGNLAVERVFSYLPGTRDTMLKGVSFSIAAGETLAIIGPSGSGKSSLVRHLVGAAVPATGAVRLEGTELNHWDPEQLGAHVGYLPQDVKLFRGTVAENIARFAPNPEDADVFAAAKLSGAHDMIQNLGQGYETDVGDGGGNLSGGQRQRIGLARAVYGSPSLVVLDEPNSNLDSYGEKALMECVRTLKARGISVILVTHKTNLLALADKTLMLNHGTVEKFGPTREIFGAPQSVPAQPAAEQAKPAKAAPKTSVVNMVSPT